MKRWEEIFTEADRALAQKAGFGVKQNFGRRPALLIIDVTRAFVGSMSRPVLEAVDEYPTSCGEVGYRALNSIQQLLEACRAKQILVIFTTGDPVMWRFYTGATKSGRVPAELLNPEANEIPKAIAPLPSELVLRKTKASAFLWTPLLGYLKAEEIDSLLIAGATTSGCLRASVVDAMSYGFRCFVIEECTFDRFELSHLVSLFDMNAKYADVIDLEEALKCIGKIG